MTKERKRSRQRGFTLVLHAAMLTFTIAAVGLAVDVGTIYMIKARLGAAVDAAALAAGRSVNLANTVALAQSQATATAQQFFNANFPAGYLNSLGTPTVTPTFTQKPDANGNPSGVLDIAVSATVSAPTYFMNIFNVSSVPVTASGTASRRGLVLMLVLDQSASMGNGAGSSCEAMRLAAQNFITLFSPYDRIGLVTFDYTAHLIYAPSTNYGDGTLKGDLGAIMCGNNTNTISALELAYQQIRSVGLPLAENTIVLFTDGSPNGVSANFPLRTVADTRWGPALAAPAPPAQVAPNSCADPAGVKDVNGDYEYEPCVGMPVPLCMTAGTVTGTLTQVSDQDPYGGHTWGLAKPMDSDANPSWPAGCPAPGNNVRQFISYIPDADIYGNNLHGVVATGLGPTVVGGRVTRDFWLYQVVNQCEPMNPSACKNMGDLWANHAGIGSGSNFFPAGNPYANLCSNPSCFRPDQPNSVVAASMNGTMSEAFRIRSDATYHPIIHSIYLTGNGKDAIDREFLPIVSNFPTIPALPYDPAPPAYTPYVNPAYQTGQETGQYLVTSDKDQLTNLFAQLASEVLRLSQ